MCKIGVDFLCCLFLWFDFSCLPFRNARKQIARIYSIFSKTVYLNILLWAHYDGRLMIIHFCTEFSTGFENKAALQSSWTDCTLFSFLEMVVSGFNDRFFLWHVLFSEKRISSQSIRVETCFPIYFSHLFFWLNNSLRCSPKCFYSITPTQRTISLWFIKDEKYVYRICKRSWTKLFATFECSNISNKQRLFLHEMKIIIAFWCSLIQWGRASGIEHLPSQF